MCGIAGTLSFEPSFRVTREHVDRMRETLAHRGPDGADTWVDDDGRIGLGFRRLAIIDLSDSAMQPMPNEDGSVRLVFNGEIYNHAEIRRELEQLGGHRFRTDHSDTEVIVHAFEQWGIDCIHRFRGMFALAIWDERAQELWLVRDRIGIKPLYWSVHHGRLNFASEIKALLTDPQQERGVDEQALYHYLSFLTTPAPQTLFKGIKKLPGGTWLRISVDGSVREQRYWDVWDNTSPLTGVSDDEIAALLLDELRTSVQLRKISDVPVGVFLSGGIDSSTNAALFSEGEAEPVRTFSIGYEGDYDSYKNEFQYARQMAELVGAEHHELKLTLDDLFDFLPEMVRLQDEPIADPVCIPVYYVSKLDGLTSWDAIAPIRERFEAKAWERSNLNWMSYIDLNLRLPELLLMRVDKMSMGVSLEARVPFLDHKFVELAMSIPEKSKTNGGTLKHILKKAVRGVIPDELIDRPKQGFGVPIHEWFFDRLGAEARPTLHEFVR